MEPHRRARHQPPLSRPTGSATGRAIVITPYLRAPARHASGQGAHVSTSSRPPSARLEEAIGLARAIDLDVVGSGLVALTAIRPATYIGKGKVDELAGLVKTQEAGLVVMDCALSPVQQRNLEVTWNAKVLDRTGLILEIFGRRAHTREGALQVELAHLNYQRSRLVRSWTHLERQRGGFGFLGGPGETQIETDRRLIAERIDRLERDLEGVKSTRKLQRESRRRVPYAIAALVGYTNAGKSTLFNRLTQANVVSADLLFATLDPTLRAVDLPHGQRVILSDTVGFISDLPTTLIAAFRATLEEVIEADLILHVRDVSHGDTLAQSQDVTRVLAELGIERDDPRLIEVWNKVDRIDTAAREQLENLGERRPEGRQPVLASALTGEGTDRLIGRIEAEIGRSREALDVFLEPTDGAGISWLHRHAEVLARETGSDGRLHMTIRADAQNAERVRAKFGTENIRPATF